VVHHRAGLARLARGSEHAEGLDAWIAHLQRDWRSAELSGRERALLEYADKLTRRPGAMQPDDLDPLRTQGLSDAAILEANLVVAYFAYANRIADGLGVALEPEREE